MLYTIGAKSALSALVKLSMTAILKPQKSKGGRPPGSRGKRAIAVEETLTRLKFSPIEFLVKVAQGKTKYPYLMSTDDKGKQIYGNAIPSIEIRFNAARELLSYIAPKRKAIEIDLRAEQIVKVEVLTGAPALSGDAPIEINPTNGNGIRA